MPKGKGGTLRRTWWARGSQRPLPWPQLRSAEWFRPASSPAPLPTRPHGSRDPRPPVRSCVQPPGPSAGLCPGAAGRRPAGRDEGLFCAGGLWGRNSSRRAAPSPSPDICLRAAAVLAGWRAGPCLLARGDRDPDLPRFGPLVRWLGTKPVCGGSLAPDPDAGCWDTLQPLGQVARPTPGLAMGSAPGLSRGCS